MATASELTPRVENLEKEVKELKSTFNEYKVESVRELTKIAERQSQTYKATEDIKVDVKSINNTVSQVQQQPAQAKAKWYDEVAKYVLLALLGYIAVKLGLK
ncbi:hypothetical protein [Erysipelothrix anatis]|uniref:hypothetical protein n=1 Tax=Erysipelothrix anatis TaxID=2683713 RepID=UPI001357ABFB|nr:hypothetical protein [Erysipelothrix anatis]